MPEETTNLDMTFKNIGNKKAQDISAVLSGLSSINAKEEMTSLSKLDKDETDVFSWVLTAPTLHSFSAEIPFTISGAIYFKYSTDAWADLGVVPSGSSYIPVMPSGSTDGPIMINISSSNSPIRTYKQQEKTPFNLKIIITNIGSGGLAYIDSNKNEISEKSNMIENLEIVFPDKFSYVCSENCQTSDEPENCYSNCGTTGAFDNRIVFDFNNHQNELRLIGNSKTIYLPFLVDETQEPYTERIFVFANYSYKVSSNPVTLYIQPID